MGIELPHFIYADYVYRHTAIFGVDEANELTHIMQPMLADVV